MPASRIAAFCLAAVVFAAPFAAAAATPPTVAVPDMEMAGDLSDAARLEEWGARSALATGALRRALAGQGVYAVVDLAPAADLIEANRSRQTVRDCPSCLAELAERVGAQRILVTWVFRMSQLVLTLHAELWEPATGRLVLRRTLSFRGDNDRSWLRAVDYLVRDIGDLAAERR